MTIAQETQARIATQTALRKASDNNKGMREEIEDLIINSLIGKKSTKKKAFEVVEKAIDRHCKGALIKKSIIPEKRKTSKHKMIEWITLDYDENKPFTRREEHLIHISYMVVNSRNPVDYQVMPTGIYLTRHALERVVLRKKVITLDEICAEFILPIKAVFFALKVREECNNPNKEGFLLVTRDAYFIIDGIDNSVSEWGIMFKSMVPVNDWSLKNKNKLDTVIDKLGDDDVAFIFLEDFNNKRIEKERVFILNAYEKSDEISKRICNYR
jgi:hypothetical protein